VELLPKVVDRRCPPCDVVTGTGEVAAENSRAQKTLAATWKWHGLPNRDEPEPHFTRSAKTLDKSMPSKVVVWVEPSALGYVQAGPKLFFRRRGDWILKQRGAYWPMQADHDKTQTEEWYRDYYARKGADRNDILANRGVLFQTLAFQRALVEALQALPVSRSWKILDVGCGTGGSLVPFLAFGFSPSSLYGIDLLSDRIAAARERFPSMHFTCGNATRMEYDSDAFDLVTESTLFIQLTDESLAASIASEMLRVVRPGGYLLLNDWRYATGHPEYRALTPRRVADLFRVGAVTKLVCRKHGALIPPLGRYLSARIPSLYFAVALAIPWAVGQMTTVLQRES